MEHTAINFILLKIWLIKLTGQESFAVVDWWAYFKIYKTEQDEIKAVFEDCREMGFDFRRPKDFLLPALLVIIDHNHDGDITNDELRSGELNNNGIQLVFKGPDVHVRFDRRERVHWHRVWSSSGIFGLFSLSSFWTPEYQDFKDSLEVIEEQRTSLDRNKDGILSYRELLFGLLRKFQIEGKLKSMKILMIACKTHQRKIYPK